MSLGVSTRTKRDDYVRLGTELRSLPLASLPRSERDLIDNDVVLHGLVKDQAIRGADFGKLYDRLQVLDVQSFARGASSTSLGKADAIYTAAKNTLAAPASPLGSSPRTRMGLFGAPANGAPTKAANEAKLDKAIEDASKLEKQGKLGEAAAKWKEVSDLRTLGAGPGDRAEQKSSAASYSAYAGDLYKKHAEQLAAKGDKEGAKQAYKNAGDAYSKAVANTGLEPNIFTHEHWDANQVADWGLEGIDAYQKAGLSIQKNGGARTIGNMDVDKVEKGVNDSYGIDRGFDRGERMMRLGDALAKSGDKAGALEAYKNAKANYDSAIADDKKTYPEGLVKHTVPAEKAQLKIAVMQASIDKDAGTKFPPSDYRAHLLAAESQPPGINKATEYARALEARNPPMPPELRAQVRREAVEAVHIEMKAVEKNGTPAQKAEHAQKAAKYFDAFGDAARTREAHAMAARANVKLAESSADPKTRGELYATAARQMELAGSFPQAEITQVHQKAAASFTLAAQVEKNDFPKAELLGRAGSEYRAGGKESEAQNAFREGAKIYLASANRPNSGSSPSDVEHKANTLGKAAALYEKAGTKKDRETAAALRDRSEVLHNQALRDKFKDPVFVPPVVLDKGEITPKSIHDYEKAVLAKHGGDPAKAAEYFETMRDKQLDAKGNVGPQFRYFDQAANRMHQHQALKDAGVKNVSHPPTRENLADYAKIRADYWRKTKDADGLPPSERDVAAKTAGELGEVAEPFYAHRDQVGKEIDYAPGGKNVITDDLSGRMHCDCEVYAYDVALAMEAAGFKASTETRDPIAGGDSHVIVNLRAKDGSDCGSISNGRYYGSADDAFSEAGLPPGSTKNATIKKREDDPRAPKL